MEISRALLRLVKKNSLASNFRHFSSGNGMIDVKVNDKTGVATMVMQKPPVNSLSTEFLNSFNDTLDTLEKNKVPGLILTSGNPNIFSAGIDLLELYNSTPEKLSKFWSTLQTTWINLYSFPFPTVALINGNAPAGGCLLAMSCEYRVMIADKYAIGLNETKLGLYAPKWFQDTMNSLIGQRRTELALTTGKLFTSKEALSAGLIDEEVSSENDGVASAEKFLALFSKIPSHARSQTKSNVRSDVLDWLLKNREHDLRIFLESITLPHVQKSLGLYLQSLKKK